MWRNETMLIPPTYPATEQFRAGRRVQEVQATPADPAIIEALVNGTSPILGVLDELGGDRTEAGLWDRITSWDAVACVAE